MIKGQVPSGPPAPSGLRGSRRKAITLNAEGMVTLEVASGADIPAVISPEVPGLDLVAWAQAGRAFLDEALNEHRAILLRGFLSCGELSPDTFAAFAASSSDGPPMDYVDRSTPRTVVGNGTYTSTVYPADRAIRVHNEGTYWKRWPLKLYFGCVTAAQTGGRTPIADVRKVLARLSQRTRWDFEELGFLLVRNFNDGFGLPWSEVFQTEDPSQVESYCRANDIEFEWKESGRLRTRQVRPAIRAHPSTGELVWFNHAAFFHSRSHPPDVLAALVEEVGADGLPWMTFFGDGTAIPDEVVDEVNAAYDAETLSFPWEAGDVLVLDNMSVAHGREPFTGDRLVLTRMAEPTGD